MKPSLLQLSKTIGYQFRDIKRLEQALTHRSADTQNNERLEFLGDSILSVVISQALFERLPKAREGELTRQRAALVKGETLAHIAKGFNLGKYLQLGMGEMRTGGQRRSSILADALEAIIAAIYCDSDYDTVRTVVLAWYQPRLQNLAAPGALKDPKTRLQEYCQARAMPLPEYEVLSTSGEPHCQTFTVACRIRDHSEIMTGVSSSRRRAEQTAAKQWLQRLTVDDE